MYRCWACGEPVARLIPYHDLIPPPTVLDSYAHHLAYLDLPPACKWAGHPARVAVVGPAITPLSFPYDHNPSNPGAPEERIRAIQEAILLLTRALQEKRRPGDGGFDAALVTALRLYSRAITPAQGAAEIRALAEP